MTSNSKEINTKQGFGLSMDAEEVEALRKELRHRRAVEHVAYLATKQWIARWRGERSPHLVNPTEGLYADEEAAFTEWVRLWHSYESLYLARRGCEKP